MLFQKKLLQSIFPRSRLYTVVPSVNGAYPLSQMGQVASRVGTLIRRTPSQTRNDGEEDPEGLLTYSNCVGSFFGTHFLMGGERYELSKPEAYLFGENCDLDLLGNKPVPFPYARHPINDHVRPLNLFVNIRKETVKFVRIRDADTEAADQYRIEFLFDADCACFVQIHFNARETYVDGEIQYIYKHQRPNCSEQFNFDAGAGQLFNHYVFNTSDFHIQELHYAGGQFFPVLIAMHTTGLESEQLQSTMASVDVATDQSATLLLKPLRQRISSDGVVYLLQEIFGLENKEYNDVHDENGFECIICMTEVRDTLILPCRHLCICSGCAENLRYKLNNCPICRSPFRALLMLKALRQAGHRTDAQNRSQARYENLTVVEALNGPLNHMQQIVGEESESPKGHRRNVSVGRIRIQQVMTVDEENPQETADGIELRDAQFFVHTPHTIIVEDNTSDNVSDKRRSTDGSVTESESSEADDGSAEEDEDTITGKVDKPHYSRVEILSDPPSEANSQSSSGGLLKGSPDE